MAGVRVRVADGLPLRLAYRSEFRSGEVIHNDRIGSAQLTELVGDAAEPNVVIRWVDSQHEHHPVGIRCSRIVVARK